jgi:hypothetical protein
MVNKSGQAGVFSTSEMELGGRETEDLPTLGGQFGWVGKDWIRAGGEIFGVFFCARQLSVDEMMDVSREMSYGRIPTIKSS